MRSPTRMIRPVFISAGMSLLAASLGLAAEFSADFVEVQGPKTSSGKLYMKGQKTRREITQGNQGIVITRPDKDVMWILNPATKTYSEMSGIADMVAAASDPDAALKGLGDRKLVGQETINGYLCDKYAFTFHDSSMGTQYQWISKKLNLMIKMASEGSTVFKMATEMRNIKEQPVPDSLFELPAGYTKVEEPGFK
jgi:outer membrane lipoprotein-sorting protein